jgi:hypothetical protein
MTSYCLTILTVFNVLPPRLQPLGRFVINEFQRSGADQRHGIGGVRGRDFGQLGAEMWIDGEDRRGHGQTSAGEFREAVCSRDPASSGEGADVQRLPFRTMSAEAEPATGRCSSLLGVPRESASRRETCGGQIGGAADAGVRAAPAGQGKPAIRATSRG